MRAVAVVVPAHDEQELLGACLDALALAATHVAVPVHVLVVLDRCRDASADVCAVRGVPVLAVDARSAGRARALGMAALVDQLGAEALWLATTDADSRVAPEWIAEQLLCAAAGADAVFGVVDVDDWSGHGIRVPHRFRALYTGTGPDGTGPHSHRHGANLGLRADRYLEVGGMPELAVGEDQALASLLEQVAGVRLVATTAVRVTTSARRRSRVVGGFASFLTSLA